ncbi:MAG: AAA family ATPase, partial [Lachnospiraceae bacterium]|nr:AAA family ATPase [Lachnospiraceae bacterium]
MARTVSIGCQDFETIRSNDYLYIDKTRFIKEWWEQGDSVTLITRPRRFGKTLAMSMVEKFFSINYADYGYLFEGLPLWEEEKYRALQGSYPVISLSFAKAKENSFLNIRKKICQIITDLYNQYDFLPDSGKLNDNEKYFFRKVSAEMEDYVATDSLNALSGYLKKYYGKKVIILLDEYDTPMQEAYVNGYWDELAGFTRSLFNATFKTNPHLERAIMTGITRISKESIFSDLNNLSVVTSTSDMYAESFGFTEDEVHTALKEYGIEQQMPEVKRWYDGFSFGSRKDIYNPWSILNYLKTEKFAPYWANTSSNSLVSKLIREGSGKIKEAFEFLLKDESIRTTIDEQIVYDLLDQDEQAVWSLLLASGYLTVKNFETYTTEFGEWKQEYELKLTNFEVKIMFRNMFRKWFSSTDSDYNDFIKALLHDDMDAMNHYMNKVSLATFSYFDTGKGPLGNEPERFYHGFVLGLIVELTDKYIITSNRESGFGRYDIIMNPRRPENDAIIIEFKVQHSSEKNLADTVQNALEQIEERNYQSALLSRGIPEERIRKYGFAFCGKKVLIG